MDTFTLVIGAGYLAASLATSWATAPIVPGMQDLPVCKAYINSHSGYIRCLDEAHYDACSVANELFEDMTTKGLPSGLTPLAPEKFHCTSIEKILTLDEIREQYPNAAYCGLDKMPLDHKAYGNYSVSKMVTERNDLYTLYDNKMFIQNLSSRLFPLTQTCNVIWSPTE